MKPASAQSETTDLDAITVAMNAPDAQVAMT